MSRVLCDVDGVLADTTCVFLASLLDATGKHFYGDQVTSWDYKECLGISEAEEALAWECFEQYHIDYVQPSPGGVEFITDLRDAGHEVIFVTAPSKHVATWTWHRDRWLAEHFGAEIPVIHTEHKHLISGDVLIDDKSGNIINWAGANPKGLGILWNQPWNQRAGISGPSWRCARTNDWHVATRLIGSSGPYRLPSVDTDGATSRRCP